MVSSRDQSGLGEGFYIAGVVKQVPRPGFDIGESVFNPPCQFVARVLRPRSHPVALGAKWDYEARVRPGPRGV